MFLGYIFVTREHCEGRYSVVCAFVGYIFVTRERRRQQCFWVTFL